MSSDPTVLPIMENLNIESSHGPIFGVGISLDKIADEAEFGMFSWTLFGNEAFGELLKKEPENVNFLSILDTCMNLFKKITSGDICAHKLLEFIKSNTAPTGPLRVVKDEELN